MLHGNQIYSHATGAFYQNWSHKLLYVFPVFCIIPKVLEKNTNGKSFQADINNPSLDNKSLVSKDFKHINQESYFAALEKGPSEKSQWGNSSPSSEQDSTTGGLDGLRARLQEEGISKAASNLPCPSQEDQILLQIMSRPGESGLADVLEGKLIHFLVI